ncbi:LOW QUALITY PROTEIN: lysine-rich arabinogalactan protein 19-like [Trachypithecus francoisi]|uniref:LOW QUALITY PROTEIN: lysine-rich arabinogalactan protein 19-like n=1 Tax=Trachypithecus francoisi TaxID=54180 RepID=UPI00141B87E0|nr:LOW QUALITY PROTEIN: lysine-rich arabinogalactan protein 19-like [Trachypithecus francoisi]
MAAASALPARESARGWEGAGLRAGMEARRRRRFSRQPNPPGRGRRLSTAAPHSSADGLSAAAPHSAAAAPFSPAARSPQRHRCLSPAAPLSPATASAPPPPDSPRPGAVLDRGSPQPAARPTSRPPSGPPRPGSSPLGALAAAPSPRHPRSLPLSRLRPPCPAPPGGPRSTPSLPGVALLGAAARRLRGLRLCALAAVAPRPPLFSGRPSRWRRSERAAEPPARAALPRASKAAPGGCRRPRRSVREARREEVAEIWPSRLCVPAWLMPPPRTRSAGSRGGAWTLAWQVPPRERGSRCVSDAFITGLGLHQGTSRTSLKTAESEAPSLGRGGPPYSWPHGLHPVSADDLFWRVKNVLGFKVQSCFLSIH